jgi:hypothetical protein
METKELAHNQQPTTWGGAGEDLQLKPLAGAAGRPGEELQLKPREELQLKPLSFSVSIRPGLIVSDRHAECRKCGWGGRLSETEAMDGINVIGAVGNWITFDCPCCGFTIEELTVDP